MNNRITSPESFFGQMPGSDRFMIHWEKLCEYYRLLEKESERIKVTRPGKTTGGNEFLILYVSSPDNLSKLDRYSEISKTLANNEKLSENEINALANEGKAVVYQDYSIHSNEIGGAQAVPLILYELLSAEDGSELSKVLDDVIFILSPCSEPDGEIKFHDYYYKYLGTRFEGFCSPHVRHSLAGHCNNRDSIYERLCESRYINDILIRSWHPQIMQAFHHQYPFDPRMTIAPTTNPMFDKFSGLMEFETNMCGAAMASELTAMGRKGIVSGDEAFNTFPITTFHHHARLHNIIGMLAENADVRIASPIYVHREKLAREHFPTWQCPVPWEGGEWHLSDIVTNIRIASIAILRHAMKHKTELLRNMAIKAKMQSERGENDPKHTILIPKAQHDGSALKSFINILQNQRVRVYETTCDIEAGGVTYPKGTYAVPLSQPKYAAVCVYCDKTAHPVNKYTFTADGTPKITDTANLSVAFSMGIKTYPAYKKIDVSLLSPCKDINVEVPTDFPMKASENASYKAVNSALSTGIKVYRDNEGNFYNENDGGRYEIAMRRVAVYHKGDSTGSFEEGFTRNILTTYGFDIITLSDKDIRENGIPDDIEVLIFSGDKKEEIAFGDDVPEHAPIEYQTGIGKNGYEALKKFFARGGRVIAWEKSCDYFNEYFHLGLKDKCKGLSPKEYGTFGSLLKAEKSDVRNDIMLGMPERFAVNSIFGTVLYPDDIVHRCDVLATFAKDDILECGYIRGEELIKGTPCIISSKIEKGDILLYTFSPHFRFQQDGTFKVLFNALYKRVGENPEDAVHFVTHYELYGN